MTERNAPVFSDGKSPDALRTIGEVANALGIRQHVLRYWEEQFPTLRPVKRSGGRRYYRPEDVALIVLIHRLVHQEGYTLRGAKQAISVRMESVDEIADASDSLESGSLDRLKAIREQLAGALASA